VENGIALRWAASKGDTAIMKTLLDKGAYVGSGEILAKALENGHIDIAKLLLGYTNLNINEKLDSDKTALIIAIEKGHIDIVRTLLDKGADVNTGSGKSRFMAGLSPLMIAIDNDQTEIVRLLLDRGVNVNDVRVESTALDHAERLNKLKIIQLLKNAGAKRGEELRR
jgi:ankyrin repeat protein